MLFFAAANIGNYGLDDYQFYMDHQIAHEQNDVSSQSLRYFIYLKWTIIKYRWCEKVWSGQSAEPLFVWPT